MLKYFKGEKMMLRVLNYIFSSVHSQFNITEENLPVEFSMNPCTRITSFLFLRSFAFSNIDESFNKISVLWIDCLKNRLRFFHFLVIFIKKMQLIFRGVLTRFCQIHRNERLQNVLKAIPSLECCILVVLVHLQGWLLSMRLHYLQQVEGLFL
jgi:hypothetical protein